MPSLHFGYSLLIGLTIATIPLSPHHRRGWTLLLPGFNRSQSEPPSCSPPVIAPCALCPSWLPLPFSHPDYDHRHGWSLHPRCCGGLAHLQPRVVREQGPVGPTPAGRLLLVGSKNPQPGKGPTQVRESDLANDGKIERDSVVKDGLV
jgi:hypothetical protein